jgi:energy-coupling factor transport system ATP-binding protein
MKLQLDNVSFSYKSKAFPPRQVFADLNLMVESGECVAITGEEGVGKSTILELLDGQQKPDAGKVLVNGTDIWQEPKRLPEFRRRIGLTFQFPEEQFCYETVKDELLFAVRNLGLQSTNDETKCIAALYEVGLSENVLSRSPFSLSMGEARRVAIASLLVLDPDAYLLDEPTAGLDGFGVDIIRSLARRLTAEGKTIVLVSHDNELMSFLASRQIVLSNGTASFVQVFPGLSRSSTTPNSQLQ